MVNMLCCVMTLIPTSRESWTPASGRSLVILGCNHYPQPQCSPLALLSFPLLSCHHLPSPLHRSECSNCEVGEQCGVLMHGRAVTFCEPFGERELVTAMLHHITTAVHFMLR